MNAVSVRRDFPSGAINDDLTSGVEETIIIKTQLVYVDSVDGSPHNTCCPPSTSCWPAHLSALRIEVPLLFPAILLLHRESWWPGIKPCPVSRNVQTDLVMTLKQSKDKHVNVFIFTFNPFCLWLLDALPSTAVTLERVKQDVFRVFRGTATQEDINGGNNDVQCKSQTSAEHSGGLMWSISLTLNSRVAKMC